MPVSLPRRFHKYWNTLLSEEPVFFFFSVGAAFLFLKIMCFGLLGGLNFSYDVIWYHLPRALMLFGIFDFHYLENSPFLLKAISHPPLAHLIQGFLIWITGTTSAMTALGMFSFVLLLAGLKITYRDDISIGAALLFAASVPLILLHIPLGLVDLWTGVLGCTAMVALERIIATPSVKWVWVSLLAVLAMIFSKMTSWPFAGLLGASTTVAIFIQCRKSLLPWTSLALYVFLGGILASVWPLHLYYTWHNVFFPYPNPLDPAAPNLPINPSYTSSTSRECWASLNTTPETRDWSNPRKFVWSFFELTRLMSPIEMNWVHGQNHYPALHHRMGGYNGITMAIGLLIVAFGARLRKDMKFPAALLLAAIVTTSFLMQSHEMRYFFYIPLMMMVIVARVAAGNERHAFYVRNILLPLAALSTMTLSTFYFAPKMMDYINKGTGWSFTAYWNALEDHVQKNGRPDGYFCMRYLGPPKTEKCENDPNSYLFSRALSAGPDMNTYPVAEWCASDAAELAPPPPVKPYP